MRLFLLLLFFLAAPAAALDPAALEKLATGDGDERIAAIGALAAEVDPRALEVLKAFAEGDLQTAGKRVLIARGANDPALDEARARFDGGLCRQPTELDGEHADQEQADDEFGQADYGQRRHRDRLVRQLVSP